MCRLSWNALEYTALFLCGNRTICLYNKQNNPWEFEDQSRDCLSIDAIEVRLNGIINLVVLMN